MTIKEAIDRNIKKIRIPTWNDDEWVEIPYLDPDGNRDNRFRIVLGNESAYIEVKELDHDQWVEVLEPLPDIPEIANLREPEISFESAKNYTMKFGPYIGFTLDEIARRDNGLKYLDNLIGKDFIYRSTKRYIEAYLNEPGIKKDLESII